MNDFGEVIDSSDIVISSSGLNVDEAKVVAISDADFESFGEVILPSQVKTYRKKQRVQLLISDAAYIRVLQNRANNGREHGVETEFELTERQQKLLDRWHKIAAEEKAEEDKAFERRMKRLQATHGRIG